MRFSTSYQGALATATLSSGFRFGKVRRKIFAGVQNRWPRDRTRLKRSRIAVVPSLQVQRSHGPGGGHPSSHQPMQKLMSDIAIRKQSENRPTTLQERTLDPWRTTRITMPKKPEVQPKKIAVKTEGQATVRS
jgi:hypothetical protein